MVNRITGALIHQVLRIARTAFDGAEDRMGRPFTEPDILGPHTRSRRVGWTHYGLMIPDLPEPHRYLTIMSLIGGTGSLAFDNDHALVASPRRNATVVVGTAATHPRHFGNYEIGRDGRFREDGSELIFGRELSITGGYPYYRVRAEIGDCAIELGIENTDKVSWFFHSPVYKHLGLLSRYRGHLTLAGERQEVEGLCSFEYGACPSAHLLHDAPLPAALKAPLDYFVYHIVNLDESNQVLLSQYSIGGRPLMTFALHRALDSHTAAYHDTTFEVLEYDDDPHPTPAGPDMRLPRRTRFTVRDRGRQWLVVETDMDTPWTYGLGTGFVSGFAYTGRWRDADLAGRGYVEYIDRRAG